MLLCVRGYMLADNLNDSTLETFTLAKTNTIMTHMLEHSSEV